MRREHPQFLQVGNDPFAVGFDAVVVFPGRLGGVGGQEQVSLPGQGGAAFDYAALKAAYVNAGGRGAWIVNNAYDKADAEAAIASGHADAVAFGRPFIANPDLVRRLREDAPLNPPDPSTFYGGGDRGYTDYPTLD